MTRSVFYRVKSPQGPWLRATGTTPFNITGLTNGVTYEVDPGNGSLVDVVLNATDGLTAKDLVLTFETTSTNEVFTVPMRNMGTYNATMNIDGGPDIAITAYNDADLTQTIPTAGVHTLRMRGNIGGLYFSSNTAMSDKLRTVSNVGLLSHDIMQGAFSSSKGLTSITFGNTDAGNASGWIFAAFNNTALTKIDFTGLNLSGVAALSGAFKNNPVLANLPGHAAAFATAAPSQIDEMFRNCPGLNGYDLDLSGMDITNFTWVGSNPLTGGAFDVITPTTAISRAMWEKTLLAWEAQTIGMTVDRIPLGFGVSPYTKGGAVEAARTALINRGYWITDAGNRVPDTPDAPTTTAVSGGFKVSFPAKPFGHGRHVTAWDVQYSADGGSNWVSRTNFTNGGTVPVADGIYLVQVRAKNFDGASAWSASDSVRVSSSAAVVTVTEEGGEPLFTIDDSVADAEAVSVTAGGTTYTTDYQGTTLTAGMLRAGPVWLTRPVITGPIEEGATLTVTPGKIVYTGDDPGDQTWVWFNNTSGSLGDTDLTYVPNEFDVGDTLRVDETYNGVTVSSLNTVAVVSGILAANPFAFANWSVTKGHDSKLNITISSLPADNGTPITNVLYELNGSGTRIPIPGYTGLNTYEIIVPASNTSYNVQLYAFNGRTSAASDIKDQTSGDVPKLVSSVPSPGALSFDPAGNITLNFDQPIQFNDSQIFLRELVGGTWEDRETFPVAGPTAKVGTGDGTVSISGNVLTINPTLAMTDGSTHAIRIANAAIVSSVGNAFAGILDDTALAFTASSAPFDPATWYAGGAKGFVIDPSDMNSQYTDATRTNLVNASGQTVRSISDKSGNGWHLYEVTANGIGTYTEADGKKYIHFTDGALRNTTDTVTRLYDVFVGFKKAPGTAGLCVFGTDNGGIFAGLGHSGAGNVPDNGMGATGVIQYFFNDGPALVAPSRGSYYTACATGQAQVAIIENPSVATTRRIGIGYQSGTSIAGPVYYAVVIESSFVTPTMRAQIIAHIQGKF